MISLAYSLLLGPQQKALYYSTNADITCKEVNKNIASVTNKMLSTEMYSFPAELIWMKVHNLKYLLMRRKMDDWKQEWFAFLFKMR